MKNRVIFFLLIGILSMNLVFAETYTLEFNQLENELIVNESVNGIQTKSYVDFESLEFAGQEIYFLNKVIFPSDFEKATITLNLEKGILIKNNKIFPSEYNLKTDGQVISIQWELTNVKKEDAFAIFVSLENTNKSNSFTLIVFIVFFALLIIILFVFFNRKNKYFKKQIKKSKKEKSTSSGDYDYLLDTEKRIIEYLKKANRNELWQKQLQVSTGFSKAKISRLIRNLESRGLVKKIPFGNTNKIRLR
jgi:uncharacterized membrane protein